MQKKAIKIQRVELALIDDINSQSDAARKKLDGVIKSTKPLFAKLTEVLNESKSTLKLIASAKQQAKALGVDIKQFSDVEDKLKNNIRIATALQSGLMSF